MTNPTRTIQAAKAFSEAFETAECHNNTIEEYDRLRDGSPEWMLAAIQAAHDGGRVLPCDWHYSTARAAADFIAEQTDADDEDELRDLAHDFAELNVDPYTHDLLQWLADVPGALDACDETAEELGTPGNSTTEDRIRCGQKAMIEGVYHCILEACQERGEELEAEGGEA
mgnify:CR=1 FL=1